MEITRTFGKFGHIAQTANKNYDDKNDLFADDVLYLLYERICGGDDKRKAEGYLDLLFMQLHDMSSGNCAQGRTIRLLQVYVMMK